MTFFCQCHFDLASPHVIKMVGIDFMYLMLVLLKLAEDETPSKPAAVVAPATAYQEPVEVEAAPPSVQHVQPSTPLEEDQVYPTEEVSGATQGSTGSSMCARALYDYQAGKYY